MSDTQFSQQTDVGELMTVLSDERCSAVVSFFRKYSGDSVSIETLASVLCDRKDGDQERLAAELHHVTLPTLAETGIITYETDENVIRYHGHPEMNQLTDLLEAL